MHVPYIVCLLSCKVSFFVMPMTRLLVLLLALVPAISYVSARHWLSKPLIGDDGRIYVCSDKNFFAFESNGSIAWSMHIDYKCNIDKAPVHGGSRKVSHFDLNLVLNMATM